jgi:hypothetical protein
LDGKGAICIFGSVYFHQGLQLISRRGSPKNGVYEFVFYNDNTLNAIPICVDERVPTKEQIATAFTFACSVDG